MNVATEVKKVPEEILQIARTIIQIKEELNEAEDKLREARKREDKSKKNELSEKIKELNKQLHKSYIILISGKENDSPQGILKYLEKLRSINQIDLEAFLTHGGLCEAISIGCELKSTQLRKLFHNIKNIRKIARKEGNIGMLKVKLLPILAYSVGRKLIDDEFYKFVKSLLNIVNDKSEYETFIEIFEAIVAYHRYYNPTQE